MEENKTIEVENEEIKISTSPIEEDATVFGLGAILTINEICRTLTAVMLAISTTYVCTSASISSQVDNNKLEKLSDQTCKMQECAQEINAIISDMRLDLVKSINPTQKEISSSIKRTYNDNLCSYCNPQTRGYCYNF